MNLKISYDENELIALLKQKDQDAFNKLYDRYSGGLYVFILQIVRTEEIANNVICEVFIIIWRTISDFDLTKTTLFIWMLQIARARAIDKITSLDKNFLKQPLMSEKETSHQLTESEIDNFGLKKVIQNLRDEQKTVICLNYFKGFSSMQISKLLAIPEEIITVRIKTSLSEIRTLLRKKQ